MKKIYHIAVKRSGHIWVGQMIKSWLKSDMKYHDLENRPVAKSIEKSDGVVVLQLRDFLNWYSSYFVHRGGKVNIKIVKRYEELMQVFYSPEDQVIRIMYDDFVQSLEYRKNICQQLEGRYNEIKLDSVRNSGGGSSFDGIKYNGNAQKMNVLKRYKQVDPLIYKKVFHRFPLIQKLYVENCSDSDKLKLSTQI